MASTDARPVPQKNVAYRVTFPILDADGDLVTGATGLDSEISKDGGTFADCTNEATEIATSSGMYYLDLTSTEMNADTVAIIVKTTSSGAKTTPIVMYPEEAGDIRVNATQIGSQTASASGTITFPNATLASTTNITAAAGCAVSSIGANVITATSIAADAITDAKVASDVTIASVTGAVGSVTGAVGSVTGAVGSVTGNVGGNVTGSVGSVTGLTNATIADAVWDEDATAHQTQGTFGQAIGDPGADTDTIFGLVNTNLDAAVSTRLASASYTAPDNTSIAAILVDTAEIGAAGAGLTALATQASVNTIDDFLDTEIAAIKAKTDNLPAAPAAVGDIPTAVQNADALLDRNVSGGSSAGRTVKQALHVLRNKTEIAAGTLTVYDVDDTTSSFTAAVTTSAGDPISAIDPA